MVVVISLIWVGDKVDVVSKCCNVDSRGELSQSGTVDDISVDESEGVDFKGVVFGVGKSLPTGCFCDVVDERIGRRLCLKRVLSLTAVAEPVFLLSKSTLKCGHECPGMVQSDESSTGRIKVGKVRKLPELSATKLQPANRRKHRTDKRGLRSFGT
jgi:hypothetical protein